MSTIKNGHILLYCPFNKIIQGPRASFQSPIEPKMLKIFVIQQTRF